MTEKCFACDKAIHGSACTAITADGAQEVFVGRDCFKRITRSGAVGFQPPKGGPRLFHSDYIQLKLK